MRVLAFDTTGSGVAIAILNNSQILAVKNIQASNIQAEILIPAIEECLNQAGIWYQDLNLIAATSGPGSFTSVRVGYATAKALKLAANLPLILINTLEAIAYDYKNSGQKILVVIDAKLDELFIQEFSVQQSNLISKLIPAYEPKLIGLNELSNFLPQGKFILAGNAKSLINEQLKNSDYISSGDDWVKASNLALLAQEIYKQNPEVNYDAIYIRKPRISERKK
jgi:tRNA threonylcarbamoyladenosine biosynthesis protein TsaB